MNINSNFFRGHINRLILLLNILIVSGAVQAQEFLTGLKTNPQIIKLNEVQQHQAQKSKNALDETPLLLPFFEDFSNYTGYPNQALFMDKQAFVTHTFAVFPPTIGVVTLDALNEYGEIYPHLNASSKGADTLTSQYIRLDSLFLDGVVRKITPADSLYFSFYFQPGGGGVVDSLMHEHIGNQPNKNDSLVLEFGLTKIEEDTAYTVWNHVWSTPGFSIKEWTSKNPLEFFKQVMIPITNEEYMRDNTLFQFRFRNYASLEPQPGISGWEGNVDQWHIDYIRLDVNRDAKDVFTNDLAFIYPTTSFLEKYQAMPWNQYQSSDRKASFSNYLTNRSNGTRTARYQYFVTQSGNEIYRGPISGSINIDPYYSHGYHTSMGPEPPRINFSPTLTDTAAIIITHIFQNVGGEDFCPTNDTCVYEQKFYNYYAYDDGTAEYGYCLNNQFNIAYLAMKFNIRVLDYLSGIQLWFNHTKNDENKDAMFSLIVWKDNNGQPGDTVCTLKGNKPNFAEQFLDFVEYQFDKKIAVQGDIWIGFEQQGNTQLNIGFDQNTDSRDFFKYNTRGIWEKSVFKGTPMLRPVFGDAKKSDTVCCGSPKMIISPNPTSGIIQVTSDKLQVTSIEIFDVFGRKLFSHTAYRTPHTTLNISHLQAGVYFVRIFKENGVFETHKIIKQ
jgi:hypothetical protein